MRNLLLLLVLLNLISCNKGSKVRFAVCADVHNDLIHDATDRMKEFIRVAEKEDADFIIQLGDFNKANKRIIACICGHDYKDRYKEIEGIHYICLNSLSYNWGGRAVEYSGRFPKNIEEKYSSQKYTLPDRNPVFAVIEENSKGVLTIDCIQSKFIPPGTEDLGVGNHNFTAIISDKTLKF